MGRRDDFLCRFERDHPVAFGTILALAIVLLYAVAGDSTLLTQITGRAA